MQALKIVLLVLALCLVVPAAVFAAAFLLVKRLRVEAVAALRSDTAGKKVYHVADCNFFGVHSAGTAQVRGKSGGELPGKDKA